MQFSDNVGGIILEIFENENKNYLQVTSGTSLYTYYKCPAECVNCSFPNNCSSCITGYTLQGGSCINPQQGSPVSSNLSHCVNNQFQVGNICQDYCHKKCKTCNKTRTDCHECADFYTKNEEGDCVVES